MNFTELKQLSAEERVNRLAERFYVEHGEKRLRKISEKLNFNLTTDESRALLTAMIGFVTATDLEKFRMPATMQIAPDLDTFGEEVIHLFKAYMPFVFGYNDGSKNEVGLFPIIARQFAGGMDPIVLLLANMDISGMSLGELVAEMKSKYGRNVSQDDVWNRITRHF